MNNQHLARVGAGCGAVFAIGLTVAVGDGSQAFSTPRAVVAIWALTLAIPFVCYVHSVVTADRAGAGWLASTALAAGITGIALKLASGGAELTIHRAGIADGSQLHQAFTEIGGALTVLSLFPLAIFCGAIAVLALASRSLPKVLGIGAALTAAALAVNGALLGTDAVPALLLFLAWTLATSVYLVIRGRRVSMPAYRADASVAAEAVRGQAAV